MNFCQLVAVFCCFATTSVALKSLEKVNKSRKGAGDLLVYEYKEEGWIEFAGLIAGSLTKQFDLSTHAKAFSASGFGLVYFDKTGDSGITVFSYTVSKFLAAPFQEDVDKIYNLHLENILDQHKTATPLRFDNWVQYENNSEKLARVVIVGEINSNLNKSHLMSPDTESLHLAAVHNETTKTLATVTVYKRKASCVLEFQVEEIQEIVKVFLAANRKVPRTLSEPILSVSSSAKDFAAFILHQTKQKERKGDPGIKFVCGGGRKGVNGFATYVVLLATPSPAIEVIRFSLDCIAKSGTISPKNQESMQNGEVAMELNSVNLTWLADASFIGIGIVQNSTTTVLVLESQIQENQVE